MSKLSEMKERAYVSWEDLHPKGNKVTFTGRCLLEEMHSPEGQQQKNVLYLVPQKGLDWTKKGVVLGAQRITDLQNLGVVDTDECKDMRALLRPQKMDNGNMTYRIYPVQEAA